MSAAAHRLGSARQNRGGAWRHRAVLVAVIALGVMGGFLLGLTIKGSKHSPGARTTLAPAVSLSVRAVTSIPAVSAAASLPPLRRPRTRAPAGVTTFGAGPSQSTPATGSLPITSATTTPTYTTSPTASPRDLEATPSKRSSGAGAVLHEESGGGA